MDKHTHSMNSDYFSDKEGASSLYHTIQKSDTFNKRLLLATSSYHRSHPPHAVQAAAGNKPEVKLPKNIVQQPETVINDISGYTTKVRRQMLDSSGKIVQSSSTHFLSPTADDDLLYQSDDERGCPRSAARNDKDAIQTVENLAGNDETKVVKAKEK